MSTRPLFLRPLPPPPPPPPPPPLIPDSFPPEFAASPQEPVADAPDEVDELGRPKAAFIRARLSSSPCDTGSEGNSWVAGGRAMGRGARAGVGRGEAAGEGAKEVGVEEDVHGVALGLKFEREDMGAKPRFEADELGRGGNGREG